MSHVSGGLSIVGLFGPTDVGTHLLNAGRPQGVEVTATDYSSAFQAGRAIRTLNWRLLGHRPARLKSFTSGLIERCKKHCPSIILCTGIAPVTREGVTAIRDLGARTAIYLTDDPWNPMRASPWFIRALPHYDYVFTTRKANLEQLRQLGCREVSYLPFAYAPEVHYLEEPTNDDVTRFRCDAIFVGGADPDRIPFIEALIESGLDIALYGGYWDRHRSTRTSARGWLDIRDIRRAVRAARTAPCLVRRSNRDGTSMRSFEVPAMGGCPVVEATEEHKELFGEEGRNVVYFDSPQSLVAQVRLLLDREDERRRLAANAMQLITGSANTYGDRLESMMATISRSAPTGSST